MKINALTFWALSVYHLSINPLLIISFHIKERTLQMRKAYLGLLIVFTSNTVSEELNAR